MTKLLHVAILVPWLMVTGVVAQTDRRIEAINTLRQKIDGDIAKSEVEGEYSNIYLIELTVNKNNGSYPAVGVYRPVVKFYYTFGDREKNPYPNRLLKIVVTIDRSNRQEYSEFVFDEAERLVFYFEKNDDIERRLYFGRGRSIQFVQNGRRLNVLTRSQTVIVAAVLNDKTRLIGIFRSSIGF